MSFLAPQFLVSKIQLISLLLGAVLLVIASDFMNRHVVFPISDMVKSAAHEGLRKKTNSKRGQVFSHHVSESLATAVFIAYCWFGSIILATYVFEPIILRLREYILLVVIALFFGISFIINTRSLRRKFLKV